MSGNWAAANTLLETFINNDTFVTYTDGEVAPEKTNLIGTKPKTDKSMAGKNLDWWYDEQLKRYLIQLTSEYS